MTIEYTPVKIPDVTFLDRRVAASDEYRTRNRRAIYLQDVRRGPRGEGQRRGPVLPVEGRRSYDVRTSDLRLRPLNRVSRIILHQTGPMPAAPDIISDSGNAPDFRTDDHRLDVVIAHLRVRRSGTVLYTHDFRLVLNGTAALRDSIEIEFEGHYNRHRLRRSRTAEQVARQTDRVSAEQLKAGRAVLKWINSLSGVPIRNIHPHQQYSPSTRPNCPGPDIWVNVGEWAKEEFGWTSNTGRRRTISDRISNPLFKQDI